ncbi:zinc finger protein 804A [Microcebus murinus]|uniref:zinc finger protein 804A n=1 Tax=Microcebus murinus TaxID=30608 RepID=UPI003F6C5835
MECYYIVISSTHLSNGHFRNIKGVFRGPLSKNGNKTLDYAEKENTIAKALEDLKANFYCELCDKQYYKHQEFDNHINSYDHAHKQRLKELKQREFARNVASKSRKDERKQEKALQRLHKLAELRKETVCAPGSGPMFKSTTVTVKENCNDISQKVVVDSVSNQQDFKYTLIHSEEDTKDVTTVAVDPENSNNYTEKNSQLGDQAQGIHRHKIGFSFAFPKKASVKLESSAAAFSEYNDDASVEKGFSRKSRFVPSACHLQLSSPTDVLLSSEEKTNSLHPPEAMYTGKETAQTQEIKEVSSEKDTLLLSSFCPLQLPLSSDAENCQNSVPAADQIPLEVIINEDTPMNSNNSELLGNKSIVFDMSTDCIAVQATTEENVKNNEPSTIKDKNKNSPETLALSNTEEDNITLHKKPDLYKRQCKPFVPVLNKHGSTVLQWPSEMLVYTATEPSISYSCNPLCFDFKSTKVNNNVDKNKLPLKDLYSLPKEEDICKRPVSDCKDVSVAGLPDYEIGGSRNEYTQVTPLLADDILSNSCDYGKNDNMGQRYKNSSCRMRKTEKCNFTKSQMKQHTLDEKYNKIKLKDTHEYWFHKSRRKKKRIKLCQHHRGLKTKESETRCKMETENSYTDMTGKNPLVPISEKQSLAAEQLIDSHQLPDKRPKAASISLRENEEIYKTWNTENNNNNAISSKNHCKKNTLLLNGQSNPTMIHSGKHNLTYSRTYCCWKAKMSSYGQHRGCLVLQNDMKCLSQNQAVKRGYNSLMNESERFRRKRRQHSYSYSSDESLNQQNYLPEESLRPPSTSVTPCKPKKKRRRKRSRFHTEFENLELKENSDCPMKGNSPLNHLDRLTNEDKKEEMKLQEVANIEKNSEQTDQVKNKLTLHPTDPLPSETNSETEHLVMEIASGELSEVSNDPTTSVYVASAPAKEVIDSTLLEHKERSENINLNEKHIPFKLPNIERNFRQSPPKSYLCHYELAEALPQGKMNEVSTEWLRYNSGILNTQPPLPFKEAHVSGHTFVTTEQILAPLALPEQTLLIPLENHDKFKNLPCEVYHHIIQPNMLANKVKLTLPPAALPPPSTPLQPLPLQQPLCSTSVTTIHHTVLQQHAAAAAAAAAATAAGTFKVLQPHQQFLSQVPALTRTSLPQISVGPVGPRLCPGNQPTFVAPPQMPIIPASVLHPSHLAFPPLPHALFPSLLSPHPTVIPLQPLF